MGKKTGLGRRRAGAEEDLAHSYRLVNIGPFGRWPCSETSRGGKRLLVWISKKGRRIHSAFKQAPETASSRSADRGKVLDVALHGTSSGGAPENSRRGVAGWGGGKAAGHPLVSEREMGWGGGGCVDGLEFVDFCGLLVYFKDRF